MISSASPPASAGETKVEESSSTASPVLTEGSRETAADVINAARPLGHGDEQQKPVKKEPTQEDILEALKRCSERRRLSEEQKRKLAEKQVVANEELKLKQKHVLFADSPTFTKSSGRQRRRTPPLRPLDSYCRELIDGLNALDRLFGQCAVGISPFQMSYLVTQVTQRIEQLLDPEQGTRVARAFCNVLGGTPLLNTVSQPPLRVPPSMLARQQRAKSAKQSTPRKSTSSKTVTPATVSPQSIPSPSASAPLNRTPKRVTAEQKTPSSDKKPPSSAKKYSARKKQSPSNAKPFVEGKLLSPLSIVYLDGTPKDVEVERRGGDQPLTGVWKSAKVYVPEIKGYNFIGRILGPRGSSIRGLEAETGCKILIRGRGSVKDEKREKHLLEHGGAGWEHLSEDLHVLVSARGETDESAKEHLKRGVDTVQKLLNPVYDEFKRQQLVQLAILNGTYRP